MTPTRAKRLSRDIMLGFIEINHQTVIPGRAVSANPESNNKDGARGRIPDPARGRPGKTLRVDRVHDFGLPRSKIIVIQPIAILSHSDDPGALDAGGDARAASLRLTACIRETNDQEPTPPHFLAAVL
jgi:hypothetical protein